MDQLRTEIAESLPTCRRGEGFAANLDIDEDAGSIRGQAVPFGKLVELLPGLFEQFDPQAFHRQLKDPARVKLCLEHGQVIGRVDTLTETEAGLQFTASIAASPDLSAARTARAMLAEDLIDEVSIGFNTVQGGTVSSVMDSGATLVTHKRARLLEVSLVPWGAYGRDATLSRAILHDPATMQAERDRLVRIEAARDWAKRFAMR